MKALQVGRADNGKPFRTPAAIGTQTSAIVGIRGSGKTVTATVMVEELLKLHHQVVIIDPTDVWWGLKSSADGSARGFPVVILGGAHGDLPLEPGMGAPLADFAVEQRVPLILSLRHLRKGKQQRLVTEFCEQLYHRKGELEHRTPLLVAIDEASAFVPQRVGGAEAQMVGAIEDLVRRGRAAGIGVALIDQRPASINKDVLTQLEVLVSHRITSPQDRKALDDWIRQHDIEGFRERFLSQLPALAQGDAWFWSPALDVFELVHVRMRETFDSSRTPKPGEQVSAPRAWAKVDLEGMRSRLAASIEEAEASDPKALQARVRELESQALNARKERQSPELEELRRGMDELQQQRRHLEEKLQRAVAIVEDLGRLLRNGSAPPPAPLAAVAPARAPAAAQARTAEPAKAEAAGVTGPQQKVLDALATLLSFGEERPETTAVAMLAGYRPSTGHFNNIRGSLNSAGLVVAEGGTISLTPAGKALARPRKIGTLEELHAAWMEVLKAPQRRLLEVVIERYPQPVRTEELAAAAGYTAGTGHFNNLRGQLHTLGAITYPGAGMVRASDLLFPAGLS